MIFATTGTQLPFDRFVKMLDEIAPLLGNEEFIVQAIPKDYVPRNFALRSFIAPDEFSDIMKKARLVVAHAGMGTIISSLERCIPIVIVPRRADLGEHRSDHQMATARRLSAMGYVAVAHDASELAARIKDADVAVRPISGLASESLADAILSVVENR